jgi:hypothetical protein
MAAKLKLVTYAEPEAAYWASQVYDADVGLASAGASLLGTSRVSISYTRATPSGLREDRAVFSLWVAKAAGANLFSMIPLSELAAMETALDTFVNAIGVAQSSSWTCVEYAWHQVNQNSPRTDDPGQRGQKMGPAVRVVTKALVPGGFAQPAPYQVSSTITLRTASRKHWGRIYVPGVAVGALQTNYGRWTNTMVDNLANALNALHNTWQDASYQLGVYSMLHPAFLTPKTIEADDIPDIVRRRRAKQMGYRKLLS